MCEGEGGKERESIPDPFLAASSMASPKRRAGAVFRVGNISQVYLPYTNVVELFKGYNSVLFPAQAPTVSMCSIRSPGRLVDFTFQKCSP